MPIQYFNENISYSYRVKRKTTALIRKILDNEKFLEGNLCIIFCSDEFLRNMNLEYLNENYYTDIITFNYNEEGKISGDLFISVDRVSENADIHQCDSITEMQRVIIHGVLHLIGYDDQNLEEQKIIRSKEDYYLNF